LYASGTNEKNFEETSKSTSDWYQIFPRLRRDFVNLVRKQKVRGKNCSMLNQKWVLARSSVSEGNISSRQQKCCMLNQKWVLASISVSGNKISSQLEEKSCVMNQKWGSARSSVSGNNISSLPAEVLRAESEVGFSQKSGVRQ
jgi:hypothetical protein